MSETIETIEVTATTRIRVVPDDGTPCPRGDYDMATGFVKIPGRGDSRVSDVPPVHSDPTGRINEAFDTLGDHRWTPHTDILFRRRREREELTVRWARAIHGHVIEYDAEHGGFWFVDPAFMEANFPALERGSKEFAEKEQEVITQDRETYRQWAEGEVYGVLFERSHELYRLDDEGVPFDEPSTIQWETVDSIFGCYLDSTYTAQVVATEHFTPEGDDEIARFKEWA